MPIDFPSDPTEGQIYTYSNKSWIYNGTAWDVAQLPLRTTLEYLVIGGGGGGAHRTGGYGGGGGGGAGGYRTNVSGELSGGSTVAEPTLPLFLGTYQIVVGAGGGWCYRH